MKQEEKQLLLQDLCVRLPYKLFAQWHHKVLNEFRGVKIMKISTYGKNIDDYHINVLCQPEPGVDYEASIVDIKPYLRPISSMTEDEREEYKKACDLDMEILSNHPMDGTTPFPILYHSQDYLNSIHVDYRGLIPMGLALEALEGMYKIN